MNILLYNIIMKTMPHVDSETYNSDKFIIKKRELWKQDIFKYVLIFAVSFVSFFFLVNVYYLGTFFFIGGFVGMMTSILFVLRAIIIYKNYYDLFKKEDIDKIEE